jgi:hypothetical protein
LNSPRAGLFFETGFDKSKMDESILVDDFASADNPMDKPVDKPVDKPMDDPAAADRPVDEPASAIVLKIYEEPANPPKGVVLKSGELCMVAIVDPFSCGRRLMIPRLHTEYRIRNSFLSYRSPYYKLSASAYAFVDLVDHLEYSLGVLSPRLSAYLKNQPRDEGHFCLAGTGCVDLCLLDPMEFEVTASRVLVLDIFCIKHCNKELINNLISEVTTDLTYTVVTGVGVVSLVFKHMIEEHYVKVLIINIHLYAYASVSDLLERARFDIEPDRIAYDGAVLTTDDRALWCQTNRIIKLNSIIGTRYSKRIYTYFAVRKFCIEGEYNYLDYSIWIDSAKMANELMAAQIRSSDRFIKHYSNNWYYYLTFTDLSNYSCRYTYLFACTQARANNRPVDIYSIGEKPVYRLDEVYSLETAKEEVLQLIKTGVTTSVFHRASIKKYLGVDVVNSIAEVYIRYGKDLQKMDNEIFQLEVINEIAPWIYELFEFIKSHLTDDNLTRKTSPEFFYKYTEITPTNYLMPRDHPTVSVEELREYVLAGITQGDQGDQGDQYYLEADEYD